MIPELPEPSGLLITSFVVLLIATIGAVCAILRRYADGPLSRLGLAFVVWVGATGLAAGSGLAARWELSPPPVMVLILVGFVATVALSQHTRARAFAREVPLGLLIGFQAFRLPLELILHQAYVEGMMPIQMSYAGQNFDIVTGLMALTIGVWGTRGPISRWAATFFNLVGLTLLFNIVGIAVASTPVFQAFGPERLNLWVATLPFIWLPAVFVLFALCGHLLLMGRLTAEAREARDAREERGN